MTAPSEEQVRAWLEQKRDKFDRLTHEAKSVRGADAFVRDWERQGDITRAALALLDAGRKDRERVDWLEQRAKRDGRDGGWNGYYNVGLIPAWDDSPVRAGGTFNCETLRAAIDRARGA